MKKIYAIFLLAAGILNTNVAQASLISVGPGLVYDSVANVTWSSDANLLGTMLAADPSLVSKIIAAVPTVTNTPNSFNPSGVYTLSAADFSAGGWADWWGGMAFMNYLNIINYLGHNTWMLPTTDQACLGFNCTSSSNMMGELYYTGLGGVAGTSIAITHNASYNLFTNIQTTSATPVYWLGTECNCNPAAAWDFWVAGISQAGSTGQNGKPGTSYSWAVLPGYVVSAVPEPGTLALLLPGLGLLGFMGKKARRRVVVDAVGTCEFRCCGTQGPAGNA